MTPLVQVKVAKINENDNITQRNIPGLLHFLVLMKFFGYRSKMREAPRFRGGNIIGKI